MFLSLVIPRCDDAHLFSQLAQGARELESILPYRFELVCVTEAGVSPPMDPKLGPEFVQWVESEGPEHGHRVRAGMLSARGLYRVLVDPRWTVRPEQLLLLLPPVQTRFDICLGSRMVLGSIRHNESVHSRLMRRAWSRLSSGALRPRVTDFLAPVQAYRADAARALFSRSVEDGRAVTVEVLALAHSLGLVIEEQAIDFEDHRGPVPRALKESIDMLLSLARIRLRLEAKAYPALNVPVPPRRIHRLHA